MVSQVKLASMASGGDFCLLGGPGGLCGFLSHAFLDVVHLELLLVSRSPRGEVGRRFVLRRGSFSRLLWCIRTVGRPTLEACGSRMGM